VLETIEHTIGYLVDNEIDLSVFEHRYNNDETGALAYDPAVLFKVILLGYARGMTSSRQRTILFADPVRGSMSRGKTVLGSTKTRPTVKRMPSATRSP
jgi:transposase